LYSYYRIIEEVDKRILKEKVISSNIIYKILKEEKFSSYKQIVKLGLTKEIKEACLV